MGRDAKAMRAPKADANQPLIVDTLRKCGLEVVIIGMPADLIVARNWVTVVVEVKNPKGSPNKHRLTKQEKDFYDLWKFKGLYCVIETLHDCRCLELAMKQGINATVDYCSSNMAIHFAVCYNSRG